MVEEWETLLDLHMVVRKGLIMDDPLVALMAVLRVGKLVENLTLKRAKHLGGNRVAALAETWAGSMDNLPVELTAGVWVDYLVDK